MDFICVTHDHKTRVCSIQIYYGAKNKINWSYCSLSLVLSVILFLLEMLTMPIKILFYTWAWGKVRPQSSHSVGHLFNPDRERDTFLWLFLADVGVPCPSSSIWLIQRCQWAKEITDNSLCGKRNRIMIKNSNYYDNSNKNVILCFSIYEHFIVHWVTCWGNGNSKGCRICEDGKKYCEQTPSNVSFCIDLWILRLHRWSVLLLQLKRLIVVGEWEWICYPFVGARK